MASSVGEFLRETRSDRGLTLEQASQATHIRKSYLEALENDQRDALPSGVQGRGFLRLYAGYLGLPADDLVKAWDGKSPFVVPSEAAPEPSAPTPSTDQPPPAGTEPPALNPALNETAAPPPPEVQPDSGPIPVEFQEILPPASDETGSLAIFQEIGERLRQQREILGLSRAEVERYTRLRQHYLQALEEGRMDLLPSPVQGRGMLSNYISFLNLNEDELMLRYAEGLQLRRVERMPPPEPQLIQSKKRPARQASPLRRFLTPDLIFGVVVVTAILFFAVRTALSINSVQNRGTQPTARAIAEILLTPGDLDSTPTAEPGGIQTPGIDETPGDTSGADNPTQAVGSNDENAAPTPSIEPTLPPINHDPLQLYIIANQRAYLKIIADNQEKFNGRVVPGNAYAFSATQRLELITGNAAALQVFYNQNDLGTLGIAGQVIGLVFVPGEMVTATPVFTFTPTPGLAPTETPKPSATPKATYTVTPLIP